MAGTPSLPTRVLLAACAALWAVLVPGQAGALMERPLGCPRWVRRASRRDGVENLGTAPLTG
jgi:hypothetical protein